MKCYLKLTFFVFALILSATTAYAEVLEKDSQGFHYYLYLPTSYEPSQEYPLIVALHWATARGTDMIERWQEPAEKLGYLVASPNSHNLRYWDIHAEDEDILRMIKEVTEDYSVDKKRIFVTGFSSGGTYALYLGLSYPETFAATAPFSSSLKWLMREAGLKPENITQKIPVCLVHGTNDITIDISESYFAQQELLKYGFKAVIKEISGLDHQYPSYVSWTIIKWFNRQGRE